MGFRFLNWIFQIFVLSEARGMEEKRADLGSREQAMSMIWESGPEVAMVRPIMLGGHWKRSESIYNIFWKWG